MDSSRWQAELAALPRDAWADHLIRHSGLPGPRANLELLDAAARLADGATIDALLARDDEYTVACAAAALGRRADDPATEPRARALAADARWRVREGVAIGLQLLGDRSPDAVAAIVREWVRDPSPLVQRAAIAAICEPRLLRTPAMARVALDTCTEATGALVALPADERRRPDVSTLRQALGYCWSVAVAADPTAGLPEFRALDTSDPDVAWIVRENSRKKRIAALL